jgi:hypothetical protein
VDDPADHLFNTIFVRHCDHLRQLSGWLN